MSLSPLDHSVQLFGISPQAAPQSPFAARHDGKAFREVVAGDDNLTNTPSVVAHRDPSGTSGQGIEQRLSGAEGVDSEAIGLPPAGNSLPVGQSGELAQALLPQATLSSYLTGTLAGGLAGLGGHRALPPGEAPVNMALTVHPLDLQSISGDLHMARTGIDSGLSDPSLANRSSDGRMLGSTLPQYPSQVSDATQNPAQQTARGIDQGAVAADLLNRVRLSNAEPLQNAAGRDLPPIGELLRIPSHQLPGRDPSGVAEGGRRALPTLEQVQIGSTGSVKAPVTSSAGSSSLATSSVVAGVSAALVSASAATVSSQGSSASGLSQPAPGSSPLAQTSELAAGASEKSVQMSIPYSASRPLTSAQQTGGSPGDASAVATARVRTVTAELSAQEVSPRSVGVLEGGKGVADEGIREAGRKMVAAGQHPERSLSTEQRIEANAAMQLNRRVPDLALPGRANVSASEGVAPTPTVQTSQVAAGLHSPLTAQISQTPEPMVAHNAALRTATGSSMTGEQVLQLESQVMKTLAGNMQAQNGRLTLQLTPQHLGDLEIQFSRETGELNIAIAARESQTRDLFESLIPRIRQSIQDMGVTVGQLTVGDQRADQRQAGTERRGDPTPSVTAPQEEPDLRVTSDPTDGLHITV